MRITSSLFSMFSMVRLRPSLFSMVFGQKETRVSNTPVISPAERAVSEYAFILIPFTFYSFSF